MGSPAESAAALQAAFKGFGTDEAAVIRVVARASSFAEIEEIKAAYHHLTGKELIKDIHSELSGNFLKVIDGILKGHLVYAAEHINKAVRGLGTDEDALIELLVGNTTEEFEAIAATYHNLYGKSLKDDIASDTSGEFKHTLLAMLEHWHSGHAAQGSVEKDAEALFQAGEGKIGTDEKVFEEIFTRSKSSHLREVFDRYENFHKHNTILAVIDSEFSGDLRKLLKAIASFAINPAQYYADLAYFAMKGLGTNDEKLIRVIVGQRARIDDIKVAFSHRYNQTLHNWVRDDTSGDYRHALLEIIKE